VFCLFWAGILPSFRAHGTEVEFRAFVQAEYRFKDDLTAWTHTAKLISSILGKKFSHAVEPQVLVDQPPGALVKLLQAPEKSSSAFQIFYIGSHVRSDGKILFCDGAKEIPSMATREVSIDGSRWNPDLVIVDTCHAVTFAYDSEWIRKFPAHYLFASDTNELALEIDFRHRQPVLFMERYPDSYQLLTNSLGEAWDGTISDLGFRLGKLVASEKSFASPLALFERLSALPREEGIPSRRFRQSHLVWRTPETVRQIAGGN